MAARTIILNIECGNFKTTLEFFTKNLILNQVAHTSASGADKLACQFCSVSILQRADKFKYNIMSH